MKFVSYIPTLIEYIYFLHLYESQEMIEIDMYVSQPYIAFN